jgi:hypothetical protein
MLARAARLRQRQAKVVRNNGTFFAKVRQAGNKLIKTRAPFLPEPQARRYTFNES